ncbi:unnamed protein product [Peniophora sp. CBMAI 1063]|nr:unnamed protein product [Peniophora sp. CBMAI 1063]
MSPTVEDEDDTHDPLFDSAYDSAYDSDYVPVEDLDSDHETAEEAAEQRRRANPTLHQAQRGSRTFPPNTAKRVRDILKFIRKKGFPDLGMFMDALFWGDPECTSDEKCRYWRTGLTDSPEFPVLLRRFSSPPGGRAHSSSGHMANFALEFAQDVVRREMDHIATHFENPPGKDPLALDTLTDLHFPALTRDLQVGAPFMWSVLTAAGWSRRQAEQNTHKTPHNVIMNIFSMLSYTRSHKRNRLATLWAIYLKSCGLSSRAYDALHAAGFVMSIKYTNDAYKKISEKQLERMQELIRRRVWLMAYDNCQIAKRVFSMRIANQPLFYSACAGTVFVFPEHVKVPDTMSKEHQAKRREGAKEPFDLHAYLAGLAPEHQSRDKRLRARYVWHILNFLLKSAEFASYPDEKRADPILAQPPPVNELPADLRNVVEQFMLKTVDIEEASYEGNIKILVAFLKQLGFDSSVDLRKLAEELLVFIAGDQLTYERLMGISRICHENINGYERYDWLVPVFGWLHLEMAFGNSLFIQYEGTDAGYGLRRAFQLMKRKGLHKVQTKGPFWHHLDEALHHVAESMILALWGEVSGLPDPSDLSALRQKSPEELQLMAEEIYDKHVCRRGWEDMLSGPIDARDEVRARSLMFIFDVLPYIELRDAIKHGDVGRMEDLLPILLQRFAGGDNPKYTILVLELLQGLEREWTSDMKDFIRRYCWVMNREGKRDTHLPIDQGQEQNIGDIKVTYRSCGPSATIEQIGNLSPAIPVFRAVRDHMKWQHKLILSRGSKHTDPNKDDDVAEFRDLAVEGEWFKYTPGRTISRSKDKAADVMTAGITNLTIGGQFDRWFDNRTFERESEQIFPSDSEGGSTEDETPSSSSSSSSSEETESDPGTVKAQRRRRGRISHRGRRAKA